jgi:hypothetical protein
MTHIKFTRMLCLCLILSATALASCSSDDGDFVNIDSGYSTTKIYENPANSYSGGISFTTSGAWTATLTGDNNPSSWLTITPMSGDKAGKQSLDLQLTANSANNDRNATLTINCGEASRTFYIVQRGNANASEDVVTTEGLTDITTSLTLTNDNPVDSVRIATVYNTPVYITGYTTNAIDKVYVEFYGYSFVTGIVSGPTTFELYPQGEEQETKHFTYLSSNGLVQKHSYRFELDSELPSNGTAVIQINTVGKFF